MFNDERINSISGKTIRNGIIISTLVSLVFLVIKSFPFRFVNIISELFIVITGIVIILIGKVKFSSLEKDERYYELKYSFYNKSAKFYLIFTMIGFALAIPFQYAILQDYLPVNMLLLSLEIIGLVFFYFQFKKNSIYFNYTFIENNKKTYYLTVLKKILHLVGAIGCIYLVSFIVGFLFFSGSSIINFLIIMVLSFLFSALSLALDYLVISVLEKISYDEKEPSKFSLVVLITGTIYVLLLIPIAYYNINTILVIEEITSSNTSLGEQIAHNMNMVNNLEYFSTGLFVIFLCYVLTKNIKSKTNRIGVCIVVVSTISTIIYQLYFSLIRILFVNNSLLIFLYQYHTYITLLLNISKAIGLLILFVGLIKSKTINSKLIIIPIVCGILLFVGQFFAGHSEIDNRFIIYTIVEIANIVVTILYVILFSVKKINKETLTTN